MQFKLSVDAFFILLIYFLFLCQSVTGIPIDLNGKQYNENGKRPLFPNQPPPHPNINRHHNHFHQQQNQNQNHQQHGQAGILMEVEDSGRLHATQSQFKRHSMTPPEAKVTSGAFQYYPGEPLVKSSSGNGNGFYNREEYPNKKQSHISKKQLPAPIIMRSVENQDARYNPNNSPKNYQHPSQMDLSSSRLQQSHLHPNAIPEGDMNPKYHQKHNLNFHKPYPQQHQHENQPPLNYLAPPQQSAPQHHSPIPIRIPIFNGNSTMYIEYDISDNDITYETTMEVEDASENNELTHVPLANII